MANSISRKFNMFNLLLGCLWGSSWRVERGMRSCISPRVDWWTLVKIEGWLVAGSRRQMVAEENKGAELAAEEKGGRRGRGGGDERGRRERHEVQTARKR